MLNSEQNLPPIFIGVLHEQLNSIVEAQVSDPAEAEQAATEADSSNGAGYIKTKKH